MTAVLITEDNLAHIKGYLRQHFGKQVKSAHRSEACGVTDAIFKRHRVQRSRSNPHPMVGSFEHIPVLAARQAAGEMFMLMYSLITAPEPVHG